MDLTVVIGGKRKEEKNLQKYIASLEDARCVARSEFFEMTGARRVLKIKNSVALTNF